MTDGTTLWRPRPPTSYTPSGKVLTVPATALAETIAKLRRERTTEAACMWLGLLDDDGNGTVTAVVVPKQINRPYNYIVPAAAVMEVSRIARARGWTVVGAVHSHPGSIVEHSTYDDEMTPSRRAVSLVMPSYGDWRRPWPQGIGVHEYADKYWHLLSDEHARKRVTLADGLAYEMLDLR